MTMTMTMTINLVTFKKLTSGVGTFAKHLQSQIPDSKLVRITKQRREYTDGYTAMLTDELPPDAPCIILDTAKAGEHDRACDFMQAHRNNVLVIHDPRSLEGDKKFCVPFARRLVVIRKKNYELAPECVFIPHPYTPRYNDEAALSERGRRWFAISHTRIDFDKNTHIFAQAIKHLDKPMRIFGRENRAYVQWKLRKHDPDWTLGQSEYHCDPAELCRTAMFDVDLTEIKGDGNGTQYCFLEACDGGAVPIMLKSWGLDEHCVHVTGVESLIDVLSSLVERPLDIVAHNRKLLDEHRNVGVQYMEFFK